MMMRFVVVNNLLVVGIILVSSIFSTGGLRQIPPPETSLSLYTLHIGNYQSKSTRVCGSTTATLSEFLGSVVLDFRQPKGKRCEHAGLPTHQWPRTNLVVNELDKLRMPGII